MTVEFALCMYTYNSMATVVADLAVVTVVPYLLQRDGVVIKSVFTRWKLV